MERVINLASKKMKFNGINESGMMSQRPGTKIPHPARMSEINLEVNAQKAWNENNSLPDYWKKTLLKPVLKKKCCDASAPCTRV